MKKIRILPISIIVALFSAFAAQAQWVKVSVPIVSGDPILALAESGGYLFAGTGQSGIFRSANNGANWTAVNNGYSTTGAVCQLVPGATSLYVTTFVSGNCFITTNNGINWTQLNPPEALGFAVIGKCLIAEGTYGIYRSADSGNTWTYNYGFELSHGYPVVVFGHYLFAGNNPGYVRSADSGATWTAPDSNSFPTGFASGVYAFASLGKYIFAGTYGPGIYRSADSGITWNAVNTGLPPDSIGLEVQALVACRGSLFAGVNVEVNTIYQTSDSGKAWKDVGTGYPEGKAAIWALAECGGYLFAGTDTNVCAAHYPISASPFCLKVQKYKVWFQRLRLNIAMRTLQFTFQLSRCAISASKFLILPERKLHPLNGIFKRQGIARLISILEK